ncbi:hypothetical protein OS493_018722 [Desmophyllum pertusum]|uniref:Fork-head domain-containing protein n=1 Tax=Desmophyllum pertusum TaxID=174260 RepID=A0A9W9ZS69_9CNID|nr:hypothetical protein OS493_018722 [Desmophyllum pertusum]
MEQLNSDSLELSSSKQRKEPCLSSKAERLKPPHSYIALIATAILNSVGQKLTLTEINEYLVQHYAFFRGPYQGWKNSVRHNLSFNKCFVKILRDPARPWGKDNYWTVSSLHDYLLADGTFRRRRRRKPKRKDEREELNHSIIHAEQILPNNAAREFGVHDAARRNIMMLPSFEPVRADRARSSSVHATNKSTTPKRFRGSFSIESILAEGKARAKEGPLGAARRGSETFPVRSVLNPNIGSLSAPRNIAHCCHPTPEAPLHFQRAEHLCAAPISPNAAYSSGCDAVWNACHCFHPCASTTHFHACY